MKIVDIKASKRDGKGKKAAKSIRAEGSMPAVIYGVSDSEKITLKTMDVFKALSGENGKAVILQLGIDGQPSRHAMLQELQYHPITDKIFHADFLEIDIKKSMTTAVRLNFTGVAVGVKIHGGSLAVHLEKINIEGLPESIPAVLNVDISALEISDKLTINDIEVPEGVKKLDDVEAGVISVAPPKKGPGGGGDAETAEGEEPATDEKPADATDEKK